jgi:predicted secreted protein
VLFKGAMREMRRRLLDVVLIAILLFSLTFMAVPVSAAGFIPSSSTMPYTSLDQVSIDESANGTTVSLTLGDDLSINLNYIAGAPFFWILQPFDTSVLEMTDNYKIPPSMPGGTGTEVWVFKAIGPGTAPINLEYQNLSGEAVDTFTVNVFVPGKGVGGEVASVNKLAILTPWILLVAALGIGGTLLVLKRRKTG